MNKLCQTSLIFFSERTACLVDRETVNIRYFDFNKSFDAVSHAILIS